MSAAGKAIGAATGKFATLRQRYVQLKYQDRRALAFLGGALTLAILWLGLWQPIENYRRDGLAAYSSAAADLDWMQGHAPAGPQAATTAPRKDDRSLLAIAGDSAALYQIALTHAEPGTDDTLHLSLDTVSYSHLLAWLESLQHDHAVRVTEISLQRLPATPGFVQATLTLHD